MRQDSINAVAKEKAELAQRQVADKAETIESPKDTTTLFYSASHGTEKPITLKNEKIEITLNTKGGTVEKAVVKNFTDYKGNPDVTLFDKNDQNLRFMLLAKENNIITSDLYFTRFRRYRLNGNDDSRRWPWKIIDNEIHSWQ